mgnify:FL=1
MLKKTIVVVALLFVMLAISPPQHANALQAGDHISATWAPWNYGASGGEFAISYYGSTDTLFTTFCVEPNEYFTPGEKLVVQSIGTTIMNNGGKTPIALNSLVAYLYHEFAHNSWNETGIFNYDNYAARKADDALLQSAIWLLQYPTQDVNNKFIDYAWKYSKIDSWTGTGDVVVLNLFSPDGGVRQDQLALVPEPTTLMLLGVGLVGVGVFRRKTK